MKRKDFLWYHWVLLGIAMLGVLGCFIPCFKSCCLHKFSFIINCLNLSVLAITAFAALLVYHRGKKIDEANFLLKIRDSLTTEKNMDVHRFFHKAGTDVSKQLTYTNQFTMSAELPFDEVELYNYLGTLELANILLKMDIIQDASFKSQFGYRIENINIQVINKMIEGQNGYWDDLKELITKFG